MYRKLKDLSLAHIVKQDTKKIKIKDKNPDPPDMKLSMYEKNNIVFDLFEKLDKKQKKIHKSSINKSFFRDLNIFDKDENSVFNTVNNTTTLFGEISLKILLYFPLYNRDILQKRQNIIKTLLPSQKQMNSLLQNFKKSQENLLWLFHEKTEEEHDYFTGLYITNTWFSFLNEYPKTLLLMHYYYTIFIPCSSILSPIVSFLISYISLRFFTGLNMSMWKFYKLFRLGMGGMLAPILGQYYQHIMMVVYTFIYITGGYTTVMNIIKRMEKCKALYEKLSSISELIKTVDALNLILMKQNAFKYFWNDELEKDFNLIRSMFSNYNSYGFFRNWGDILYKFSKISEHEESIANLMKYIGTIDSHISIINTIQKHNICFSEFIKSKKPSIKITGLTHPSLSNNKNLVANDLDLNTFQNILLFGPNASGKSLLIKSLVINVLLSQTLTISYCNSIEITPFCILNTYLNIPDLVGKESLFEAEVHRCKDYIKRIKRAKKHNFALTVFDELFSSTNYHEGISTSYAICKYLSKFPNSINIITTHFHKLSKMEKENLFKCYSMKVSQKENGDIRFHYKLQDKLEKHKLAIELLRMKSLDKEIIDCALKFYKDTFIKKKKRRKNKKRKEVILIEN